MELGSRFLLLASVCFLGIVSGEEAGGDCKCNDPKELLTSALTEKEVLMKKWGDACTVETKETKEWMAAVDTDGANAARDARMKDKKALSAALEGRVDGLNKFLAELGNIRRSLGVHIERVNKVYQNKYKANLNDQMAAAATLHDLSIDHAPPQSILLAPIPQVEGFQSAAAEAAPAAASDAVAPASSLLSVAETDGKHVAFLETVRKAVASRTSLCHEAGCTGAYESAYELYKLGWKNNQRLQVMFKKEGRTLGLFQKKLADLIGKKKAKLLKLSTQLKNLNQALATPDPPLSDLFPLITQHYQEFTKVCTNFALSSAQGKGALQAMLQAIAPPSSQDAAAAAPGAVPAPVTSF